MVETGARTDKGVGLAMLFGALGIVGAAVMFVAAANQLAAGWGFALAMVAGGLSIAAVHLFD